MEPNVQTLVNPAPRPLCDKVGPLLKILFLGLSMTSYAMVITLIARNYEEEDSQIKNEPAAGSIVKLLALGCLLTTVMFMVLLGAQADNSWMVDKVALVTFLFAIYISFTLFVWPFSVLRLMILIVDICLVVVSAFLARQLKRSFPNTWRPAGDCLIIFA